MHLLASHRGESVLLVWRDSLSAFHTGTGDVVLSVHATPPSVPSLPNPPGKLSVEVTSSTMFF